MKKTNPKIDAFISDEKKWRKEFERLRTICLGTGLTEELKWGKPCYTFEEHNVVIIQGFKEYCALMFTNGALLKDPKGILKRIGEHTQAARQARFTRVQEVAEVESTLEGLHQGGCRSGKGRLEGRSKDEPHSDAKGIEKQVGRQSRPENGLLCPDARAAKGVHLLYLVGQAIKDPGLEDRFVQEPNLRGKGI